MRANKEYIQGVFNRSWYLVIPFFQRSYVWSNEQWERFLTDMYSICQYKQEYFLGSVILKKENEYSEDKVVVDGQQRLTTLILFFKVLLLMQDKNSEFDILFKRLEDGKSILQHNKNDRKSFETILNLGILQKFDNPHNNIEKCYNFFVENINKDELVFVDLLKYIAFVSIELESYENEQQIFDTINNFGVNLTTADLLKNQFFRNDEVELYEKYWQNIFEKDKETVDYWNITANKKENKTLIDIFLFSFLQIYTKDLPVDKKGFNQSTNLLKSYKKLIPNIENKQAFFKELERYATIFKTSINPNIASERLETQMDRMNLIVFEGGLFSIVPYVIFVLSHYEYAPEQRDETLFVLESYLLRRMVGIDKSTFATKLYHDLFGSYLIGNNIVSANALKIHFNGYRSGHLNSVPTDTEIKLLLKNKAQPQAKALLILYLLDNKIRQNAGGEPLYEINKYYVEYLMPVKWQKHWQQPINEDIRKIAVKTIGNTTITPQKLNATLKESDWHARVNGVGRAKGLLAYNHLSLVKPLLNLDKWTDEEIAKNNERLANKMIEIWKL